MNKGSESIMINNRVYGATHVKERFWVSILTVVSLLTVLINLGNDYCINQSFLGFLVLLHSVYVLYRYRDNVGLFIAAFFMLFSNYSIVMGVYWDKSIRPEALYPQIRDLQIYAKSITTLLVFEITITIYSIINNKNVVRKEYREKNDKPTAMEKIVSVVCGMIVVVIFLTQFKRGSETSRASLTPLFEYKIIFIIIGMIYGKNNKFLKYMWLALIAVTSGASFISGNRVDGLVAVIAYGVYYHDDLPTSRLAAILFCGAFLMIGIGYMRAEVSLDSERWRSVGEKIQREKFTFDTAVWAYFPAVSSVALASGTAGVLNKLQMLKDHIIYIFLGGEYGRLRLQFVTRIYYFHTNGFFSPLYFYIWIRELSGMVFGLLINTYIKIVVKASGKLSNFKYGIFLYFIAMTPRWYLYDPFSLLRGVMLFSIVLLSVTAMLDLLKKT